MKGRQSRGVVLITTMLTLVLVIMLVSSVVHSNIGNMRLSATFAIRETALMAAHSGVQYAMTRLQDDLLWMGAPENGRLLRVKSSLSRSDDTYFVEVSEKDGNVIGKVLSANGQPSFFRIKFNYEDDLSSDTSEDSGALGLDALKNSERPIPSTFVSVNNLFNTSPTTVYLAKLDGTLKVQRQQNKHGQEVLGVSEEDGRGSYSLAPATCALIVEGFAGNSLRDLDLSSFVSLQSESNSPLAMGPQSQADSSLARRVVEVYLTTNYNDDSLDAVAYAAGDMAAVCGELKTDAPGKSGSANIYARNDIDFYLNTLDMGSNSLRYGGSLMIDSLQEGGLVDAKYQDGSLSSVSDEDIRAVTWDEVRKAGKSDKGDNFLDAGYYVFKRIYKYNPDGHYDFNSGETKLFYYPTKELYDLHAERCVVGDNAPENLRLQGGFEVKYERPSFSKPSTWRKKLLAGGRISVDLEKATLTLNGDVNIKGAGDAVESDFVVAFAQGVSPKKVPRPMLAFRTDRRQDADPVLTFDSQEYKGTGNIIIQGGVMGGGLINARGDIQFQGPSVLEVEPGVGPTIYACGDVLVDGITNASAGATQDGSGGELNNSEPPPKDAYWDAVWNAFKIENQGIDVQNSYALYYDIYKEMATGITTFRHDGNTYSGDLKECIEQAYDPKEKDWDDIEDFVEDLGQTVVKNKEASDLPDVEGLVDIIASNVATNTDGWYSHLSNLSEPDPDPDEDSKKDSGLPSFNGQVESGGVDPSQMGVTDGDTDQTAYKEAYLAELMARWGGEVGYGDQDLSGVIYAQGSITINAGPNSNLNLTGTIIAYGGDPASGRPGSANLGQTISPTPTPTPDTSTDGTATTEPDKGVDYKERPQGSITITARRAELIMEPDYVRGLLEMAPKPKMEKLMYALY